MSSIEVQLGHVRFGATSAEVLRQLFPLGSTPEGVCARVGVFGCVVLATVCHRLGCGGYARPIPLDDELCR